MKIHIFNKRLTGKQKKRDFSNFSEDGKFLYQVLAHEPTE